jgi:glucose-6-phosphate 1-dehydrogenase
MHKSPALEPAILVIFGITGDLAQRKLLPALYHLLKDKLLHEHTIILGISRREITSDEILREVKLCANEQDGVCDPAALATMRERLQLMQLDMANGEAYGGLLERVNGIEEEHGMCMNRLYYLAIPPQVAGPVVNFLGEHGLNQSCPHNNAATRLLVEKPFGFDLHSAEELIESTTRHFSEEQLFRIDHYVAKETVQNILTFRFSNPIFESIWDNKHIARIAITAHEQIGIEGRAVFYEQTGALRDFIQSHLLQLLALVTMEKPAAMSSKEIHKAKLAALESTAGPTPETVHANAVRGQYDTYREEVHNPKSHTETYAAVRVHIDTDRWRGVPIVVRTGKALNAKTTEIAVEFKGDGTDESNILTFYIQPNEGIELDLRVKKPGFEHDMQTAKMDFSYQRTFVGGHDHPDAYERVLVDAVRGDHTLFATGAEVLAAWRILQAVINAWCDSDADLHIYAAGSEGPKAAQKLFAAS